MVEFCFSVLDPVENFDGWNIFLSISIYYYIEFKTVWLCTHWILEFVFEEGTLVVIS